MTSEQEFNAATVEEALERASASLGTPADELAYEVMDSGSSGFMGIGARDARIMVTVNGSSNEISEPQPETPDPDVPDDHAPRTAESPELDDEAQETVSDELLHETRQYMETVVDGLNLSDARLDIYDAGDFVAVDVTTEEAGLFIGQKGETIDALQYLLNVAVYRDRPFAKRIILDSEGYRQRRIEALQGMAHRSARRAVREKRMIELPPMNPGERRVVHIFLKENQRVTTASEGAGDNRRVCISPV